MNKGVKKPPYLRNKKYVKRKRDMEKETWKTIGIRDKWQIINGTVLIFAAIALYFLSFALTLAIGMGVVSACSTMLATGLAFFGITSYIKNQMTSFETKINERMNNIEEDERKRKDGYAEVQEEDGE